MNAFGFYRICLNRSFSGAWAAAWISSSIFTILGASIALFWAPFGNIMNLLIGLIPLAIFVMLMIAGPLRAAFHLHQEQAETIRKNQRLEQEGAQLVSPLINSKATQDDLAAEAKVNALISDENHIVMAVSQSGELLLKVANSGDIERSIRLAKEDVEVRFPTIVGATLGWREKEKFVSAINKAKEASPDDWPFLHKVAADYLFGRTQARRSEKINKMISEMSQESLELSRRVINPPSNKLA